MRFLNVRKTLTAARTLYDLLRERPEYANISHKEMPTWESHRAFIASEPYLKWYIISIEGNHVGAIYLDYRFEIGIGIFKEFQRMGYATEAIKKLMLRHKGEEFLANIAPANKQSKDLFERLGFVHCQCTYKFND